MLDIYPRNGPAQGIGIINFYGTGFRSDFPLAELGCKIGNSEGQAILVSDQQIRCVVEDIETVAEGEALAAQVALNSYSWSTPNDDAGDTGYTFFVPYTMNQIFPASGPSIGGTDVLIQGRGFVDTGESELPRCRFGTPANYVIVDADILSYNRLVCRTPEVLTATKPAIWPVDVPVALALTSDSFEPWTQTSHKFRFYKQPSISGIYPETVDIGKITEIVVTIDKDLSDTSDEQLQNVFFDPVPIHQISEFDEDEEESTGLALGSFPMLKCSFGRFGETTGVFVDETHIKCMTPSVPDDPEEIYLEEVDFLVTMNGFDYDMDNAD